MSILLISIFVSAIIMCIIMVRLTSKGVCFNKAYIFSVHNAIYCSIIFNLSYDYKYVGDGYSPTIENFKTIVITDNNFICLNNLGDSIYGASGKNIRVDNLNDLFIVENKSVVMGDNISNYFVLDKLPDDSCILHIPNNIKIIKIK